MPPGALWEIARLNRWGSSFGFAPLARGRTTGSMAGETLARRLPLPQAFHLSILVPPVMLAIRWILKGMPDHCVSGL
jgi:hypothetical protein